MWVQSACWMSVIHRAATCTFCRRAYGIGDVREGLRALLAVAREDLHLRCDELMCSDVSLLMPAELCDVPMRRMCCTVCLLRCGVILLRCGVRGNEVIWPAISHRAVGQQVDLRALAVVLVLRQEGGAFVLELRQRVGDALADLGQHRLQRHAWRCELSASASRPGSQTTLLDRLGSMSRSS